MDENLHHVLRMAAVGMLREEVGGSAMTVGSNSMRMPNAKTLFEAYLVMENM